ncbi:hypothetical protein GGD46_005984 [Rhizobium lusitanum]|uniref:Uncharacterized protein n=1 Tax=Rhizobium lusitanum TaxID=293958 RepID=A0A7X0MFE1_9HYPH|nr:hypothetical protein [Rhizobium lusitanum]
MLRPAAVSLTLFRPVKDFVVDWPRTVFDMIEGRNLLGL